MPSSAPCHRRSFARRQDPLHLGGGGLQRTLRSFEVALRELVTRAGFQVLFEPPSCFLRPELNADIQEPRPPTSC
jgi:hypothetical protein